MARLRSAAGVVSGPGAVGGRMKNRGDGAGGERLGQGGGAPGSSQPVGGVGVEPAGPHRVGQEGAHRRGLAGHRAGGIPTRGERGGEGPHRPPVDPAEALDAPPCAEPAELGEVPTVGGHRVVAEPPAHSQPLEVTGDVVGQRVHRRRRRRGVDGVSCSRVVHDPMVLATSGTVNDPGYPAMARTEPEGLGPSCGGTSEVGSDSHRRAQHQAELLDQVIGVEDRVGAVADEQVAAT